MCVQYRGGAQYRGGCSVPWGISWVPWGISWVPWGCSVPWGISWVPWGVVLSTMGDVQYRGGISWCPWGISWVPWRVFSTMGGKSFVIWVPQGTEHPHGTHDIPPHASWYPPTVLKFQRMVSPHGTEHPHGTHDIPPRASWYPPRASWYPPRASWYPPHASWYPPRYWTSPTVLNIPHGTQDNPPRYSWYSPTVLNTPTVLKISPTFIMISPTVLNTPTVLMISPRYWTPPTVLSTPHGTAHTLYRVVMRFDIFIPVSPIAFRLSLLQWPQRTCSVKVWCTKIARILRIVVQTGENLAVWSGNWYHYIWFISGKI